MVALTTAAEAANPDMIGAAVLLGWGLLDCFFGYRIFRVAVALLGALVVGLFVAGLATQWFGSGDLVFWTSFAGGAVLGFVISFAAYLVGVFLAAFSFGYVLVLGLSPVLGTSATLLVGALAGAVCGVLALVMQRLFVSAATAFTGAFRVALALAFFLEGLDWQYYLRSPEQVPALIAGRWWVAAVILGLGLVGLAVQLRTAPKGKKTEG